MSSMQNLCSLTRIRPRPCTGRVESNHWSTREVPVQEAWFFPNLEFKVAVWLPRRPLCKFYQGYFPWAESRIWRHIPSTPGAIGNRDRPLFCCKLDPRPAFHILSAKLNPLTSFSVLSSPALILTSLLFSDCPSLPFLSLPFLFSLGLFFKRREVERRAWDGCSVSLDSPRNLLQVNEQGL